MKQCKKKMNMTAEDVRDLLFYCPLTGVFTRRISVAPNARAGDVAGCRRDDGYILIGLRSANYFGHHLAWLYMTGEWPTCFIDHRNRDTSDNRWDNLRPASRGQNAANTLPPRTNTSGIKGVSWDKRRRKWAVRLKIDQKNLFVGRFDRIEDAASAYRAQAKLTFGEFARHDAGGAS